MLCKSIKRLKIVKFGGKVEKKQWIKYNMLYQPIYFETAEFHWTVKTFKAVFSSW